MASPAGGEDRLVLFYVVSRSQVEHVGPVALVLGNGGQPSSFARQQNLAAQPEFQKRLGAVAGQGTNLERLGQASGYQFTAIADHHHPPGQRELSSRRNLGRDRAAAGRDGIAGRWLPGTKIVQVFLCCRSPFWQTQKDSERRSPTEERRG